MSAATTSEQPETELTPELIERVLKLSPENRERLRALLGAPPNSDADWEYWKAEIKRRIEDIESGRVKAITPEEMFANVRKALEEARKT
jgi:putative addiction module component (TIGR02574 family)